MSKLDFTPVNSKVVTNTIVVQRLKSPKCNNKRLKTLG